MSDARTAQWKRLRASLATEYRESNYRTAGNYFLSSEAKDTLLVAWYQVDARTPGRYIKFCVNLEVFLLRLVDPARRRLPDTRMIKWENPHWRERLTAVDRPDDWWFLDTEDNARGSELIEWHRQQVAQSIVPRLQEFGSEESMLGFWLSGKPGWLGQAERDMYLPRLLRLRSRPASLE